MAFYAPTTEQSVFEGRSGLGLFGTGEGLVLFGTSLNFFDWFDLVQIWFKLFKPGTNGFECFN